MRIILIVLALALVACGEKEVEQSSVNFRSHSGGLSFTVDTVITVLFCEECLIDSATILAGDMLFIGPAILSEGAIGDIYRFRVDTTWMDSDTEILQKTI